jgi:acetylornithine deacetylase/succinyl-diaminopimelate desuccinylase-like protein
MRTSLIVFLAAVVSVCPAGAQDDGPYNLAARAILKELVEINTTDSSGSMTKAAEAMAARLKGAGFADADVQVIGPDARKGNLVARLRGRGTSDDKGQAAIWIANLIRYKQEGFAPARDIVVALTADEEGGDSNGVKWLLENHRGLIDAEYVLNEGGGGELRDGKAVANSVQAAEKMYYSVAMEVRNPGGHSSLPRKDNAIYRLAAGLTRLAAFDFPVELNEITRGFFAGMAALESGRTAADLKAAAGPAPDLAAVARLAAESPLYNSMTRSTCVATRLTGGHAENALPQLARAVVNCRLLPGSDPRAVEQTLKEVVADEAIVFTTVWEPVASPPSPLRPELMAAVTRHTDELWPGAVVLPVMSTGATDGLYLRNAGIPTYGVEAVFSDPNDVRAHGRDERIGIKAFYDAREFLYRLVKTLGSQGSGRSESES